MRNVGEEQSVDEAFKRGQKSLDITKEERRKKKKDEAGAELQIGGGVSGQNTGLDANQFHPSPAWSCQ